MEYFEQQALSSAEKKAAYTGTGTWMTLSLCGFTERKRTRNHYDILNSIHPEVEQNGSFPFLDFQ